MTLTVLCGLFKMVNFMFVTFTAPPPPKKMSFLKMGASNSKSPRKALPGLASAICPSLNQSLWTVIVRNAVVGQVLLLCPPPGPHSDQ